MNVFNNTSYGFLIDGEAINLETNESYSLSNCIQAVMIKNAFIENIFPLYVIKLQLTPDLRDTLRDNDIKVHLKISYYDMLAENYLEETNNNNVSILGICFDGDIRIYEKPYATTASKIEEETDNTEGSKNNSIPYVEYEMTGIPEEAINKNEVCVNNIFENAELADCLVYLLTSVNKKSKMYIEEPINRSVYNSILVPPVNLVPALNFLDEQYHRFYNNTANLFIDDSNIFFYDPLSENKPVINTIELNIITKEATGDIQQGQIPAVDEENNIKLIYKKPPGYLNESKIASHKLGDYTVYYYYDDNYNLVNRTRTNSEAYPKTRYIWNILKDKSPEMLDTSTAISFNLSNLNPYIITPLTKLKIISSEYKNLEGDYTIINTSNGFGTSDKKHFTNSIIISAIKK